MNHPSPHVFPYQAMATGFEIRIALGDREYARQAARAACDVCTRMEGLLSRYDPASEISAVNRLADGEAIRLSPETFACLALAEELQRRTRGAFDPGLGAWTVPAPEGGPAPAPRGQLLLDPDRLAAGRRGGAVSLDLGAIGKGYALDRMAETLREWEIEDALLVAGGSSIIALGAPDPEETGWEIGIGLEGQPSRLFRLRDGAIGSSGAAVKGVHILDPATGAPRMNHTRSWAVSREAAVCDALSTAWMNLLPPEIEKICLQLPESGALLGNGGEIREIALPPFFRRL